MNSPLGMYLIHNGNITNTDELKVLLNSKSSFFNRYLRTDSDSEVTTDTSVSIAYIVILSLDPSDFGTDTELCDEAISEHSFACDASPLHCSVSSKKARQPLIHAEPV